MIVTLDQIVPCILEEIFQLLLASWKSEIFKQSQVNLNLEIITWPFSLVLTLLPK